MTKYISIITLVCCLFAAAGASVAAAQNRGGDAVLVAAGKNTLRQRDVDALVEFYEWAFAHRFTDAERDRFQAAVVENFRAAAAGHRQGTDALIAAFAKVKTLDEATREAKREKLTAGFVDDMRQASSDATGRVLVEIYDASRGAASASADEPPMPVVTDGAGDVNADDGGAAGVGSLAALAGKWAWGRSGSSTYTTGGAYVGGNGSRFTYEFAASGAVNYTGIMNVMTGGCRLQAFTVKKGRATLSGDTLTIRWQPAAFSRDDTCSPSKNYKKTLPAEIETFRVALKDSYGQRQLCLTGKDETCFSPEK